MTTSDLAVLQNFPFNPGRETAIPEMIRILRKHLGMDIAFLGEFSSESREIKLVDTDEVDCAMKTGLATPLEESYCQLIIDGKLPKIMNNTSDYPLAMALKVTEQLDIRAYIAAPILLSDGSIYGTLCCYSHTPQAAFTERDLNMMRACAEMTANQIDLERKSTRENRDARDRIASILNAEKLSIVYQPICDLRQRRIAGYEALARFKDYPDKSPDIIFGEAQKVGMGNELESRAISLGLHALSHFDDRVYVAVNASPSTILCPKFASLFEDLPLERITLEITEHAAVTQYAEIKEALDPLRQRGLHLAVDDAGGGFSSFRHILELAPDRIKLDASLTKNIDSDPVRRALVAAFVRFTQDTSMKLIAEGVQTKTELSALQDLGLEKVQGYYLGEPLPLQQARQANFRV